MRYCAPDITKERESHACTCLLVLPQGYRSQYRQKVFVCSCIYSGMDYKTLQACVITEWVVGRIDELEKMSYCGRILICHGDDLILSFLDSNIRSRDQCKFTSLP